MWCPASDNHEILWRPCPAINKQSQIVEQSHRIQLDWLACKHKWTTKLTLHFYLAFYLIWITVIKSRLVCIKEERGKYSSKSDYGSYYRFHFKNSRSVPSDNLFNFLNHAINLSHVHMFHTDSNMTHIYKLSVKRNLYTAHKKLSIFDFGRKFFNISKNVCKWLKSL